MDRCEEPEPSPEAHRRATGECMVLRCGQRGVRGREDAGDAATQRGHDDDRDDGDKDDDECVLDQTLPLAGLHSQKVEVVSKNVDHDVPFPAPAVTLQESY